MKTPEVGLESIPYYWKSWRQTWQSTGTVIRQPPFDLSIPRTLSVSHREFACSQLLAKSSSPFLLKERGWSIKKGSRRYSRFPFVSKPFEKGSVSNELPVLNFLFYPLVRTTRMAYCTEVRDEKKLPSKVESMKKLPIGLQSFEKIATEGWSYVDKTPLIHKLVNEGNYYFLSRPRRFGKSLLVNTLKALFSGQESLFKNLHLGSINYNWKEHPVIHLDFSTLSYKDPNALENSLKEELNRIAKSYYMFPIFEPLPKTLPLEKGRVFYDLPSFETGFRHLVETLARKNKVVILIDECDKLLIDHVDNLQLAEQNRIALRDFFTIFKSLDYYLRFVFFTGVSKFSQVSLLSGINNLNDISTRPAFDCLVGYTEEEIRFYFAQQISEIAKKQRKSFEEVIDTMRHWYNGYCFSEAKKTVYNPFSTLLFLQDGKINNYWFSTATPSSLIREIKKLPSPFPLEQIDGKIEVGSEVFNHPELTNPNLISLMWQTGYLTIKDYNSSNGLYRLGYPNEEVRSSLRNVLKASKGACQLP